MFMKITIKNKTFDVEYLNKKEDIQKGMMGRDKLNGCMLFDLGRGEHSFWMKDCLIPLDIVFVLNNKISKIHKDCKPCKENCEERYKGYGDYVLEFPSGTSNNWIIGEKIFLNRL
jgi:uncharacterized membrane protein (UPF0127 family)